MKNNLKTGHRDFLVILSALFGYYFFYIIFHGFFQRDLFLWLTPLLLGFLIIALRRIKTSRAQSLAILLLSVVVFFYVVEIYLKVTSQNISRITPSRYVTSKSDLGYRAFSGNYHAKSTYRKTKENIYDVTYSINEDGYRITPNSNENGDAILFFGCSFTFGEGLEANQTLPSQFLALTGNKFNVMNFGFSGYGPHQMLRSLELGKPDKYIKKNVKAVFFQLIDSHVYRVSGKTSWGSNDPFYDFNEKNELVYQGSVNWKYSAIPLFKRSMIYHNFYSKIFGSNKEDLERLIAILRKSKEIVETKYHAKFYVILWLGETYPYMKEMHDRLAQEFNLIWVPELLPLNEGEDWSKKYSIVNDGHPNAYSYNLIAKHLVKCCTK